MNGAEEEGDAGQLGLGCGDPLPGAGRGRGGRGQRPSPAGVDGSGPKLADVLPRAAMAPGRLVACECVYMTVCVHVCVCARALTRFGACVCVCVRTIAPFVSWRLWAWRERKRAGSWLLVWD